MVLDQPFPVFEPYTHNPFQDYEEEEEEDTSKTYNQSYQISHLKTNETIDVKRLAMLSSLSEEHVQSLCDGTYRREQLKNEFIKNQEQEFEKRAKLAKGLLLYKYHDKIELIEKLYEIESFQNPFATFDLETFSDENFCFAKQLLQKVTELLALIVHFDIKEPFRISEFGYNYKNVTQVRSNETHQLVREYTTLSYESSISMQMFLPRTFKIAESLHIPLFFYMGKLFPSA